MSVVATCDRVLALVARAEPDAEAAVNATHGPDALTRFANSSIHQNVSEDGGGVALRVALPDGRSATATTTRTDDDGLAALVARTLAAAGLRPADPSWPGVAPPARVAAGADHWDDGTAAATPEDRAALVRAFADAGRDLGVHAAGYVTTKATTAAFANTAGQRLEGRATIAVLEGMHRSDGGDGTARQASVRLGDLDGAAAGAVAAQKAAAQRAGSLVDVEPGTYEVVLEPGCVANMLRFLALGLNGKALADGTSFAHVGERQFDPAVHLWDDATDPRADGFLYDLEGTPKRRLDLVAAGVTTAVAHDRRSAARAGVESTGHATRDESSGGVVGNVFMGAGDQRREHLVAGVERGLLVTDFHYTRILDPKTQVVTGLTRNGTFLIERGEVTSAVRNLRFTQSYVAALGPGRVLAIGDDAQLVASIYGMGSAHVPSLRLAAWNFTGGSRG